MGCSKDPAEKISQSELEGAVNLMVKNFESIEALAEKGDAVAQYNLGLMYIRGHGVEQDFNEAFKWTKKAADQGFGEAQYNLGLLYSNGDGVLKDDKEAVKWWRKAAEQGFAEACITYDLEGSRVGAVS